MLYVVYSLCNLKFPSEYISNQGINFQMFMMKLKCWVKGKMKWLLYKISAELHQIYHSMHGDNLG